MITFENKVAIVTGGASGIGEATARTFAALGANVVIADVDDARAKALADELSSAGGGVVSCATDINSEDQIRNMVDTAVRNFGGVDILHNCAGVPRTIAPDCEVIDMPLEWWNRTIAGHLTSTMLGCKHVLPRLIERGGGAIVNTSSGAAYGATVDLVAYGSAKAAIHQLTQEVAATYGRDNVRCNVVVPGPVLTERGKVTLGPEMFAILANETPLPRLARAQDLANAVIFLASDLAAMITGQALAVDGGLMTKMPYWLPKMRAARGERFDAAAFKYEDV